MSATDPFSRVRVRWLPLWLLAALTIEAFVEEAIPARNGADWSEVTTEYLFYATIALWALRQCAVAAISPRELLGPFPRPRAQWRLVALAIPLIPISIGSLWLFWMPVSYVFPDFVSEWVLSDDPPTWISSAPFRSSLMVLSTVLFVPIVEELAFRGVILHRWAYKWGTVGGIAASSIVFGIVHADILGVTAFGLAMALLYVKTGGLWVPIGCHVVNNATAVIAEPFFPDEVTTVAQFQREWYFGVIPLLLGIVLVYALRRHYLPSAESSVPPLARGEDARSAS